MKRLQGDGDGDITGHGTDRDDTYGGGDDDDDGYDDDFGSPPNVYDDLDQDQAMDYGQNNAEAGGDAQVEDAFGDLDAQIAARQSGPAVERIMADSTDEIGKDPTDMYAYLDSAFLRNWAGPEHWKLRRPRKGKQSYMRPQPCQVIYFDIHFCMSLTFSFVFLTRFIVHREKA